jgi:uncharacterized integral membrane protein
MLFSVMTAWKKSWYFLLFFIPLSSGVQSLRGYVMWILRWFFAAGFIILGIGFAMQNADQLVTISLLHWKSQNTPLWVVMYLAFAMGVVFWMIVSLFKAVTLRTENQRIVKETKKLKEELDRLRNISVEEAIAFLDSNAKSLNPSRKE